MESARVDSPDSGASFAWRHGPRSAREPSRASDNKRHRAPAREGSRCATMTFARERRALGEALFRRGSPHHRARPRARARLAWAIDGNRRARPAYARASHGVTATTHNRRRTEPNHPVCAHTAWTHRGRVLRLRGTPTTNARERGCEAATKENPAPVRARASWTHSAITAGAPGRNRSINRAYGSRHGV